MATAVPGTTYALTVTLTRNPSLELWDEVCGALFSHGVLGIDEGEEGPPAGEAALMAGTAPESDDEFLQAIAPGVLSPPRSFTAYFSSQSDAYEAWADVQPRLHGLEPLADFDSLAPRDYSEEWKKNFKPLYCAPRWLVRAPWHTDADCAAALPAASMLPSLKTILIEPGMAFGTGNHETTRSCLTLLSRSFARLRAAGRPPQATLDFGCGSGILAIGLRLEGAASALAVDIDPLALDASLANAARSHTTVEVSDFVPDGMEGRFDVVVANILKNTLLDFSERLAGWVAPDGELVLSGLLVAQGAEIEARFTELGLRLEERLIDGEWISLRLAKP